VNAASLAPPGTRREVLATLAIVGACAALAGGRPIARRLSRHPTPERCAAMLDRYTDQEALARGRGPSGARVPLESPDVASCARELTAGEVECALQSGYADELERCLPQVP
jgi:hypothetical protein